MLARLLATRTARRPSVRARWFSCRPENSHSRSSIRSHPYAGSLGLNVRAAVGGTPFTKQVDQLRRGVDILVATPGRLGDHLRPTRASSARSR